MKGVKYDAGKPRWSLLPWDVMDWVVRVLTVGAVKYSDDNWKKVPNAKDRYESALMRHIRNHKKGIWLDEGEGGTNCPSLANALVCLIFWFWLELKERKLTDDELHRLSQ